MLPTRGRVDLCGSILTDVRVWVRVDSAESNIHHPLILAYITRLMFSISFSLLFPSSTPLQQAHRVPQCPRFYVDLYIPELALKCCSLLLPRDEHKHEHC